MSSVTDANGSTTTTTTESDLQDHQSKPCQMDGQPASSDDALSCSASDSHDGGSTITKHQTSPQHAKQNMVERRAGTNDQARYSPSVVEQHVEERADELAAPSLTMVDFEVPADLMDIDSSLHIDQQDALTAGYAMFEQQQNEDWETLVGLFGSIPSTPQFTSALSASATKQHCSGTPKPKDPDPLLQGDHHLGHASKRDLCNAAMAKITSLAHSEPAVPSFLPETQTTIGMVANEQPGQSMPTPPQAGQTPSKPLSSAWASWPTALSVPGLSPLVLGPTQDLPHANPNDDDFPKDIHHWSILQCCPFDTFIAPARAKENLVYFERISKHAEPWTAADGTLDDITAGQTDDFVRTPLSTITREKISAITQSFFRRALDMHGFGYTPPTFASQSVGGWFTSSTFILLPPPTSIERFLYNYIQFTDPFYPLFAGRHFDPNQLLDDDNEQAATLLVTLMIAYGAMMDTATQSRRFAAGLTEISRIALSDILEKHNSLSTSEMLLRCALLFILQAAWGGDKWQMDIGEGHRSMYIAMLRNSRYLARQSMTFPADGTEQDLNVIWKSWTNFESRNRLAYDWVLADQELCLFHGHPTKFSIAELEAPLPDKDELWLARNPEEWKRTLDCEDGAIRNIPEYFSRRPQYSLRLLFQLFLDNDLAQPSLAMSPLRLRLLLYPLQTLVQHYCQLLNIFSDSGVSVTVSKTMTRTSSLVRVEEIQILLERWGSLAETCTPVGERQKRVSDTNYILYHLISLDVHTSFKEMEAFARGCRPDWASSRVPYAAERWIYAVPEALFHCGQILRLTREIPLAARPLWWAAAIYRATIVLWIYSLSCTFGPSQPTLPNPGFSLIEPETPIQIDQLSSKDPQMKQFLKYNRGDPRLSKPDGTSVRFDSPSTVLDVCIAAVDGGPGSLWFAMGVKQKLEHLAKLWSPAGSEDPTSLL
ncbi:hypothetical protein LTS07_005442 [Exophiala sideris]|uniref:Xylanolytic transcriptional activator regulatory domain-containing protein n=1 Tax=Exophiala sideris TaxID=1016849 RepID=A0ABR0JBC9_9EURO|nr:hypothetical protein LTS07_005442 [Exophiala sideris]KAK5038712.1 hypothetical protein LTR13_004459 [Exophiala sideris]KAK5060593.1 hypothetical protein LTR69_005910 [Exophiala sideris]KAK5183505.1 hypothetical protein LTR44_004506 [Eurotiomycetes sp. CCFEE 6388]